MACSKLDVRSADPRRHLLDAMLRPESIAVIGASAKPESFGYNLVSQLLSGGYGGRIFPVNPQYAEIAGLKCYSSISEIPEPVDCSLLAVSDRHLETALESAAAANSRSAVVFGNVVGRDLPNGRPLADRITAIARSAEMALCGGNCMGYFNFIDAIRVGGFPFQEEYAPPRGKAAVISHSGACYSALTLNQRQLGMSYLISSGQELVTTAGEYLTFLLNQPETRVVGCILETIRDPEQFLDALELADRAGVPVVVLKLGRSVRGQSLTFAHSGALSGNDAAYRAVFERYNVVPVHSLDELANTLELFSAGREPTTPYLGLATDSGGERTMIADLAADVGLAFAEISSDTSARLAAVLDPELEPVNPLDVWDTGRDHERVTEECLTLLADDPAVGQVVFATNMLSGRPILETWGRVIEGAHNRTSKPVIAMANLTSAVDRTKAAELRQHGIPVLTGTQASLVALAGSSRWHEFRRHRRNQGIQWPAEDIVLQWRDRLRGAGSKALDHIASLKFVEDFGIKTAHGLAVKGESEAISAAEQLGFPVVLKTLAEGIHHKFDRGGVVVGLNSPDMVAEAYANMAARLGPMCLVQAQVQSGIEIYLGISADPQFGPVATVGIGGIYVETLSDTVTFLPPIDEAQAYQFLQRLRGFPLLVGARGQPPANVDELCRVIARVSAVAASLRGYISELDINPIIVRPEGVVAVDALVISV